MFRFTNKSEVLRKLAPILNNSIVLPQLFFTVREWEADSAAVLDRLEKDADLQWPLIVRSSSEDEDTYVSSNAGRYTSVLHVSTVAEAREAIDKVITSYTSTCGTQLVFVQPMLSDVQIFGVAFTVDPNTGGNYIVINFDESGSTNGITGGESSSKYQCYYYYKEAPIPPDQKLARVIAMAQELQEVCENDTLDIEFAIRCDKIYLFQVRPLIVKAKRVSKALEARTLKLIYNKIKSMQGARPYIYGEKTIYGVMPDWNPAEIIGIRPKRLALSMYKELICDEIWAYQRDNYGYKNLRSFPLLINFAGLPYIDIRVSFNSFLPKQLDDELSRKLIEYYIDRLYQNPGLHDKVEFQIVFSCFTFDLDEKMAVLQNHGFTLDEIQQIKQSLLELTNSIISDKNALLQCDLNKIHTLESRQKVILESNMDKVSKIYWLLEDCKRYGTLPFAGLARCGFISVAILQSMVRTGLLSQRDYQNFMANIESVNSNILKELNILSKEDFLKKYGHLRPGTYDITAERYDEAPDKYFDFNSTVHLNEKEDAIFSMTLQQMKDIGNKLKENGFSCDALQLFDFLKAAIEGREYAKFVFTRSVSDALQLLKQLAGDLAIDVQDAAYADISVIADCYSSENDVKTALVKSILAGKEKYALSYSCNLPPLIREANDIYSYFQQESLPNYITLKSVTADVCTTEDFSLKGKIVFIPNADPGFDWIFSREIAGLVTMYGGCNSHMAIIAAELQLPSIIGIGSQLYHYFLKAKSVQLNCLERRLEIIKWR